MPVECERKYLVKNDSWRENADGGRFFRQGYLPTANGVTVRVRITPEGGFLTIKGPRRGNCSRDEYEYPVPAAEAEEMLRKLCVPFPVEKVRYLVKEGDRVWEVDVFEGLNAGLVTAELELQSEDEAFEKPDWLGLEVSGDVRYGNGALAVNPYVRWGKKNAGNK